LTTMSDDDDWVHFSGEEGGGSERGVRSRPRRAAAVAAAAPMAATAAEEAESGEASEEESEAAVAAAAEEAEMESEEEEEAEEAEEENVADGCRLKHTQVYVDFNDARRVRIRGGPRVLEQHEVRGPRVRKDRVTGKMRVLVHPETMERHCNAMSKFFQKERRRGFFDTRGGEYFWKRRGKRVAGHYVKFTDDDDCLDGARHTEPLSEEHEGAIDWVYDLILDGRLGVVRVCTCPTHKFAYRRALPRWTSSPGAGLIAATRFRCALYLGKTLVKGYRWHPDPTEPEYFVLDLAIVIDLGKETERLHFAIEIQHTHANSPEKRAAFNKHHIQQVQIFAMELLAAAAAAGPVAQVVVKDHLIDAREPYECSPCVLAQAEEEKRRDEERAKREAEALAERAEKRAKAEAAAWLRSKSLSEATMKKLAMPFIYRPDARVACYQELLAKHKGDPKHFKMYMWTRNEADPPFLLLEVAKDGETTLINPSITRTAKDMDELRKRGADSWEGEWCKDPRREEERRVAPPPAPPHPAPPPPVPPPPAPPGLSAEQRARMVRNLAEAQERRAKVARR
jgi:hypothetical protein